MTAHDDEVRQLARMLEARFAAARDDWQPFAPAEDAHEAATTREQRAAHTRNEDVRAALGKLDGTEAGRAACLALMLLSLWSQAQLLNVAPTLPVGAS